jgi:hypothetical protein
MFGNLRRKCQRLPELSSPEAFLNSGDVWAILAILAISFHPIPKSAADSSGVPHLRQMTAEQSPQIRGSVTSQAQVGQ